MTLGLFFSLESFSLQSFPNNDSIVNRRLRDLEERIIRQERKINRLEVENHELKSAISEIHARPTIRLGRRTTINRIGSKQLVSE